MSIKRGKGELLLFGSQLLPNTHLELSALSHEDYFSFIMYRLLPLPLEILIKSGVRLGNLYFYKPPSDSDVRQGLRATGVDRWSICSCCWAGLAESWVGMCCPLVPLIASYTSASYSNTAECWWSCCLTLLWGFLSNSLEILALGH